MEEGARGGRGYGVRMVAAIGRRSTEAEHIQEEWLTRGGVQRGQRWLSGRDCGRAGGRGRNGVGRRGEKEGGAVCLSPNPKGRMRGVAHALLHALSFSLTHTQTYLWV